MERTHCRTAVGMVAVSLWLTAANLSQGASERERETQEKEDFADMAAISSDDSPLPTQSITKIIERAITTFVYIRMVSTSSFLGMKPAARIMIPLKKGSIISLCSVASALGGLGPHAYTGSKHAVLGLTKNVAAELGFHGIRVNCISPYAVATPLALALLPEEARTEDAMAGFRAFVGKNANLQGVELTVEDVANAALFLLVTNRSLGYWFIINPYNQPPRGAVVKDGHVAEEDEASSVEEEETSDVVETVFVDGLSVEPKRRGDRSMVGAEGSIVMGVAAIASSSDIDSDTTKL
ncbi:hypothetical protein RJ639_003488 [Escallonia herrerae]|uniref:Uncharacterized protein n=1 Tax=Escallonia herrerae TaxID=1293975 RepID=A0AA88VZZ3_9ASTE|nr:hypothetical protein RJ639_003488 [Escallonia herrerae]